MKNKKDKIILFANFTGNFPYININYFVLLTWPIFLNVRLTTDVYCWITYLWQMAKLDWYYQLCVNSNKPKGNRYYVIQSLFAWVNIIIEQGNFYLH